MSERLIVSGNPNRPIDYLWLQETLEFIVRNDAAELGCTDLAINKAYYPIFLVAGGCPNMFCGMQAVVYCASSNGNVDFWWVKPDKTNPLGNTIERQTLNRHGKGHHKNDPGRSKPFYKPLADLFSGEEKCPVTGLRYKVEKVSGTTSKKPTMRAFIEREEGGKVERLYIFLAWQEDWTSNPFARTKFIKGKIMYQKDPEAAVYFARQYYIANNQLTLSAREETLAPSVLPGDEIKELRAD